MDGKAFPVQPEAPGGAAGVELAAFHPALTAPAHIAGDGFALLLGEGGIDGGDELTAHIGGVDALALEADIFFRLFHNHFWTPFQKFSRFFQSGDQRFRHSLLCDAFCFGDFALCFPFDAILPESVKLCPSQYASDPRNRRLRTTNLIFSDLPFLCQSLLIGNSKGGFRNHVHRCGVVAFLHIAFILCVKVLVRPPLPTAKLCFIGEISAGQADQISIGVWKYNGIWIFLVQCVDAPSVIHFWFLHILKSVGCKFQNTGGLRQRGCPKGAKKPTAISLWA